MCYYSTNEVQEALGWDSGYFFVIDNLFAVFCLFVAKHDPLSFDILNYLLYCFWD